MRNLVPTRGDYALPSNVSPRQLAGRTRRSLNSIRERIEQLSVPWADVDNAVVWALDDLLVAFDEFERTVNQSVDYLMEAAP